MSTINASITNAKSIPYSARITFVPLSNPQAEAAVLITAKVLTLRTDMSGLGSINLEQGNYKVLVEDDPPIYINVPNDSATYDLTDRIVDGTGLDQDTAKILTGTALLMPCVGTGKYHRVSLKLEDGNVLWDIEQ